MGKIKVGIIGVGNISEDHLRGYFQNENVEVYAFCDIDKEKLERKAKLHGVERTYTDMHEMLALKELDAVSVCVWNVNHHACVMAALKAGKHVLCEKPLAMNAKQAEEMRAEAEKQGVLLMVGFVMRFADESKIALDLINDGALGDIYYSKATYLRRHGCPGGWFADSDRSGGGPVIDLGVHVIDHTRYLMGRPKPVSVYAATFDKLKNRPWLKTNVGWRPEGASDADKCDVEDLAVALIRYDNGAVTLLETSYSLNGSGLTAKDLYGTKGGLALAGQPKLYTTVNGYLADIELQTARLKAGGKGMFIEEIDHFVDCIVNGTPCIAPAEDGVIVMKILDAIYESAKTGHEVIL